MVDVVAPGDAGQRLARLPPLPSLPLLVRRKLEGAPHLPACGLGARTALARAGADQLALELCKARQHRQHEPTVRGGGVGPGVAERAEHGALLGDAAEDVEQVPCRARQPVEPGHQHHVAGREGREASVKLRTLALSSRDLLAEHTDCARSLQLGQLRVERLPVAADARIAKDQGGGRRRDHAEGPKLRT